MKNLTEKEEDIFMAYIRTGKTKAYIAKDFGISMDYLQSILDRSGAASDGGRRTEQAESILRVTKEAEWKTVITNLVKRKSRISISYVLHVMLEKWIRTSDAIKEMGH